MADNPSPDPESSGDEELPDNIVYVCRRCNGQEFTSAQKDAHEEYHRQQKLEKQKKRLKSTY